MKADYTILCENSVASSKGLIGEHGWAVHVQTPEANYLFDTGQGLGVRHNADILGVNLADLNTICISHGHYDHTSGLPAVLQKTGKIDVFGHPEMFQTRYWQEEGNREIGIRYRREYLESLGAQFRLVSRFTEIADGVFLTGEVERVTDFEQPDPHMVAVQSDGELAQDQLRDDLSMVLRGDQGLVVILGCAHAGLINILLHVQQHLPNEPIHTVFGGTHLGFAGPEQFEQTLNHLDQFDVQKLGAAHCTGLANSARLAARLSDRFFFASAGIRFSC